MTVDRRETSKGVRYRARYRGADSRWHSKTFTRRVDAVSWVEEARRAVSRGGWVDPAMGRTAFATWASRWEATLIDLSPKTRAGYESLLRVHVLPVFGSAELRQITTMAVREWVAELQEAGLSPSRIRQAHQVLHAALRAAVEADYLARNPAAGVKLPRSAHRDTRFLSAAQLENLATAAGDRWRTLIYVLGLGGLRWGEATALRVSRCDLLRSRLEVAESLTELAGRLSFGPTKSHRTRWVSIPPELRDLLGREIAGHTADELVFRADAGGPLRHSNFSGRVWRRIVAAAGLPTDLRIHDLRHTAASLLIAAGVHPKAVQAHLGHSSITVTMDRYGHLYPDTDTAVAEALSAAVSQGIASSARPGTVLDLPKPLTPQRDSGS